MVKKQFNWYLHDDLDGMEPEDFEWFPGDQFNDPQLGIKVGQAMQEQRTFYEVELICEYDDETGQVRIIDLGVVK